MIVKSRSFRLAGATWCLPLNLLRSGPWLLIAVRRQGSGIGKFLRGMADFNALLFFGKPAMEFKDRVLKCTDCSAEFVFTAGEQLFFHDKQFTNDPKHCKQCKAKRARGGSRARPETRTNCAQCGEPTTVPFKPSQGRPVLCRSCYQLAQGKATPAHEVATEPLVMQGPG